MGLQIKDGGVSVPRRERWTIYHSTKKQTQINCPSFPNLSIDEVTATYPCAGLCVHCLLVLWSMEWLQQIDHFQRWLDRSFGRIRDPKGNLTQIAYDAKGNPLTITDALNQVTTFTYNPQGLLLTTKDALNQTTTFTYDALGRLLTTTDPLNRTTTLTYDAAGNVATSTDALNRTTTFTYDAKNRLVEIRDTNDGRTTYTYDGNGNLLTRITPKNETISFA